ncbi:MAG: ornithine carbamoyltransferase [Thermomicrobium sp.]|nr:ornithine carbamoyltransferase [Thermomicrobium sp.]MDW8005112.1 ornithine carbamoyltransferase [Thermomicrobium sp.]
MAVPVVRKQFHLLTDDDLSPEQAVALIDFAAQLKAQHRAGEPQHHLLRGKTLAMIFQKPSTRTRVAFEAGMTQLGGHALYLSTNDLQLGRGETIADTARVLSRYVDAIMARVFRHIDVVELATHATVPVINGLSDLAHPTQGLADMLTIKERFGGWSGRVLTYLGCANNMAHSLALSGALVGLSVRIATPPSCQPDPGIIERARKIGTRTGATIELLSDPLEAVRGVDIVYTDVWVSMGQNVPEETLRELEAYRVTPALMSAAAPHAIFMHCLPMFRGQEVTAEVADGPQSVIFDQAENRLHLHKALLVELLSDAGPGVLR